MKTEYFAFALNEYHYRVISFTRHFKREAAEKSAYRPYGGTASSDYSSEVLTREGLIAWAKECDYEIDWTNRTLKYLGD